MKKIQEFLLMLLIIFTSSVYGDSHNNMLKSAKSKMDTISVDLNKGHFYAGAGLSSMGLNNTVSEESFSTYAKNIMGGYQYGEYMAVELRYASGVGAVEYISDTEGVSSNDDYPTNFTSAGAYMKALYPVGDIKLYGLLGYGQVRLSNIPEGDTEKSETTMQWGFGLSYRVYDKIQLFADYVNLYDDVGFDTLGENSDMEVSILTFGFSYWF